MPHITEPQTGLHTPLGATRAGIWIRNDQAITWAADLQKALRHFTGPPTCRMVLEELAELLGKAKQC